MSRLRRLRALSPAERRLLPRVWWLLLRVRVSIRLRGYNRTVASLSRSGARPRPQRTGLAPSRIACLLEVTSHVVPGGQHCLSRSLALATLLRRRGHDATIEFGVARSEGGALDAHAWVRIGGEVLLGGEELERFTRLIGPDASGADGDASAVASDARVTPRPRRGS